MEMFGAPFRHTGATFLSKKNARNTTGLLPRQGGIVANAVRELQWIS
jgi:hypothetical protein